MTASIELPRRMPAGQRKSSILAPNGQPVSYFLYPSTRSNPRAYKPRFWLQDSTRKNFTEWDRKEAVNYTRQLAVQVDPLNAAIKQKNDWAFGDAWDPHYTGTNKAWGRIAQDWLRNVWFPNACVRGPQYDFKRCLWLSGWAWDVDGDDVMILTETASGFPQVAFYPGTKVGCGNEKPARDGKPGTVQSGQYAGAQIFDGIIMDRNSRPIAIRILGEDGDGKQIYQDVSTYNADLAYEPTWSDQGRGIPRLLVSSLTWTDYQDTTTFTWRGVKRASSVGLITKNAEGEAGIGNEIITQEESPTAPDSDRQVAYEELEGGEMYYLSSADGEEIVPLNFKNPHPNVEAFITRMIRGAISSIGWYLELLDLSQSGRAAARLLTDQANQTIWSRQCTGYRRWKRAIGYAVAKGMKIGQIPRNEEGADPYQWEPGLPKPLQVDAGNDAQADREGLKLGINNKAILAQRNHGLHYVEMDDQRERELRETIARAQSISADTGVPFDRCLELLEQRSPNPIAQQPQQRQAPATAAKADRSLVMNLTDSPPRPKSWKMQRDERGAMIGLVPEF